MVNVLCVALFTRAWIEMIQDEFTKQEQRVALFTRAWIEISVIVNTTSTDSSRPLYEGVD